MKVKLIDLPYLLDANSLSEKSKQKMYPVILISMMSQKRAHVMVKGYRLVANNKYEVTT
jgi:hypothetical protein